MFFTVVAAVSVGLIAWRGDELRSPGMIDNPVSREASFLANNLLFGALAFVVLLGTVFPLVAEAWDGTRLTIGRPYFDSLGRPIGLALLFLMAVAPILPWRKASTEVLSTRLFWPAVIGVGAMAISLLVGARGIAPVITFGLGGFAGGAALRQIALATRRQGWRGLVGRTNGGMVVHLGVVLLAVGLAASESYKSDRTVLLDVGDSVTVEGHEFTYLEAGADINERRLRTFALIEIDGGDVYAPAITTFLQAGSIVPTPSVRSGFTEDVFLVLDELPDRVDDAIRLRVIIRPLVAWIWTGGLLMALGTALAIVPGRRASSRPSRSDRSGPDAAGPDSDPTEGDPTKDEPTAESEPSEGELVGD